ncbi:universal stress protein [Lutibaculum baratangense]|uniref:Universal stress protein (Usp) n=1 Tax=Lutibaculum baratangense AMV1 TaxID=631454 RepID=V4QVW7_9HYPH|nr:universal stress protein [Lutibaculum baratangense]ESR23872.1 Universal stress protein (Usp) [Lutibaculum baratangense AMV1]
MYKKIMVPVDLSHIDRLQKALDTGADLARHYGVPICYVGVTSAAPGPLGHNPQEYSRKLSEFAQAEADRRSIAAEARAYVSHDPAVDLDKTLLGAAHDVEADLVVMASHVPGLPDHIFASNAGYLASHADISVFVVR